MTIEKDPNGLDQHALGAKTDAGKPMVAQILKMFARALWEVSRVGTHGALKYTLGGWQYVDDGINRYEDAQMRHKLKEWMGQEYDTELPVLHAAQDAWNALARLELILREKDKNSEKYI